ncbi:isoleucine-tRNA ligase [Mycoemilia scoparia]|uniref:isoleucine--tRNA ligase n=1 Tax=Mycoemilia scoparia TaxID=417184 RepID=A0A9W8AAZ3_9FUNG|nr:isoleucine-tRNA ligase [Mycoemilia scoparia]
MVLHMRMDRSTVACHFLNKVLKDIINRYNVLKGRRVFYKPGWDCHGLPIEIKALELLKKRGVKDLSPKEIRHHAREFAHKTVNEQMEEYKRWGIMGDWKNPYLTLDPKYETNQLKVFYKMFKKGLIYRQNKPVYWSPSSRTALAEAELEYNEKHVSRSVYTQFKLTPASFAKLGLKDCKAQAFFLAWTTTPWTLPANKALAVNKDLDYIVLSVKDGIQSNTYIFAGSRLEFLKSAFGDKFGERNDLAGCSYIHQFTGETSPVLSADYVSADSGTGIVHSAPGHGKEDYEFGVANNLTIFSPVDGEGRFTDEVDPRLKGKQVLSEGTTETISILNEKNLIIHEEKYTHSYPYDWRTKLPVIQRATPQWFANVQSIQKPVVEALKGVKMIPESGHRRLEAFVRGRKEWCISRQRSWGVPIPVLYDLETGEPLLTDASITHIIKVIGENGGSDAWWLLPTEKFVPEEYKNRRYRRGEDTMDVWFDSGTSWASIQSDLDKLSKRQADMYLEGSDQHRGWFQSSLLTSYAARELVPYKTVLTHGFIQDESGKKMSKSLGNVVVPDTIINGGRDKKAQPAYGVDVMRLWVASTDYRHDANIGPVLIAKTSENMRKIRNTIRFMLGNLDGFTHKQLVPYENLTPIDKYILHELAVFKDKSKEAYESFAFYQVLREVNIFTNVKLSALYFDIIKDRLYADHGCSTRRLAAQTSLYHIFINYVTTIAPILCHLVEEAYSFASNDLLTEKKSSIFKEPWQQVDPAWSNPEIKSEWEILLQIRTTINQAIDAGRQGGTIGSSLESAVDISIEDEELRGIVDRYGKYYMQRTQDLKEASIISNIVVSEKPSIDVQEKIYRQNGSVSFGSDSTEEQMNSHTRYTITLGKAEKYKCPRCWVYSSDTKDELCQRCVEAVNKNAV